MTAVYWLGVALDALCVVVLLWPSMVLARFQIDTAGTVGPAIRFPAFVAAALMAGWTTLLAWGALSPVGRRGTLLVTAFPVMAGLLASSVYLGVNSAAGIVRVVPMLAVQAVVLGLMVSAWVVAGRIASRR